MFIHFWIVGRILVTRKDFGRKFITTHKDFGRIFIAT
jgi:hypothetical protein